MSAPGSHEQCRRSWKARHVFVSSAPTPSRCSLDGRGLPSGVPLGSRPAHLPLSSSSLGRPRGPITPFLFTRGRDPLDLFPARQSVPAADPFPHNPAGWPWQASLLPFWCPRTGPRKDAPVYPGPPSRSGTGTQTPVFQFPVRVLPTPCMKLRICRFLL